MSSQEVEFLEDYILAVDRLKVVDDLYDDDTLDYWYWSVLNAQVKGDTRQLNQWIDDAANTQFVETEKMQELFFRQALMDYSPENADQVGQKLIEICTNVNLDHTQDAAYVNVATTEYPTQLQLLTKRLLEDEFRLVTSGESSIVDVFTPRAADFLAKQPLEVSEQRADFLELVEGESPDITNLLGHIQADLEAGTIFGERAIHQKLTRFHMEKLVQNMPAQGKDPGILGDEAFLVSFAKKIRPITDKRIEYDTELLATYLRDLKKFALNIIGDNHASLKALILFNCIRFQESQDEGYSKKIVQEYMAVPKFRNVFKPNASVTDTNPQIASDPYWCTDEIPELKPIEEDERLIRRAMVTFFLDGDKTDQWTKYTHKQLYALPLWSEAYLLVGRGKKDFQIAQQRTIEQSEIVPGAWKRLVDRVELEFYSTNKTFFNPADDVSLKFITKNNPVINVSVYEVSAKNYYKSKQTEIPENINLSGSATIYETTITSEVAAVRRSVEELALPCLSGRRGVFVVDMVGNALTARALIRKGELRYISDQNKETLDGYCFKVFNENSEMVQRPRIWMSDNYYECDENGDIHIPFSNDAVTENELLILEDLDAEGSATLQGFTRELPSYKLMCGMYIDREQILKKKEARILIRANLYMNSEMISLSLLENVQFKLNLTDNLGNQKTRIEPIALDDENETIFTFTVPTELRSIECILTCEVNGSHLISKQHIGVNATDDTMAIANMFMFRSGSAGYVLSVLGKNGEGYPNVPIKLSFKHRYFTNPIEDQVQTDANGQVYLGRLPDVDVVEAVCDEAFVAGEASFDMLNNFVTVPTVIHRAHGTPVRLPFTPEVEDKDPRIFLYDADHIQSFSNLATYANGYITIEGLPSGDFVLYIRDYQSLEVQIKISEGVQLSNQLGAYVLGASRVLQLSEDFPLQITGVTGTRTDGYQIKLDGINERTRVHIICLTQNPVFSIYGFLSSPFCPPDEIKFASDPSEYSKAHELSEEVLYIVNRKNAQKYIGNMLPAPGVLNKAWTKQDEVVRVQDPVAFKRSAHDASSKLSGSKKTLLDIGKSQKSREADAAALEFLSDTSFVYANRSVNEDGIVELGADLIGAQHNVVQILAVDDDNTCLHNIILDEVTEDTEVPATDVRLNTNLECAKHFTEVRKVICLQNKSDDYTIADFSTAEYEPYETLEEPYNLYRHLAENVSTEMKDEYLKFGPLVQWDQLTDEGRLEFYDKMACNEVNYFLYRRDQGFFENVVTPILTDKIQKTFFDKYLLGMPLLEYCATAKFTQLNTLEQILLADRLASGPWTEKTLRSIAEKSDLEAIDPREQNEVFNLAINSRQLGVAEAQNQMNKIEATVAEQYFERQMAQTNAVMGSLGVEVNTAPKKYTNRSASEKYITQTCEYQEMGYYKVPNTKLSSKLVKASRFWYDYAQYLLADEASRSDGFLSPWFTGANSNINEMLLGLAVLDVPLSADEPKRLYSSTGGNEVRVLAKDPVILFVRELVETDVRTSAISVSTNYFDPLERTHISDGEKVDKFIAGSFQTNKVYGSRVVVTNVSSVPQNVEVLCQIPKGAIPCGVQCFQTQSWAQVIEAYGTYRREYFYYWPEPGSFVHYPAHVNKNGDTVGYGLDNRVLTVETAVTPTDTDSWKYISNLAEEQAILEFLGNSPQALSVDLSKICWRFPDNSEFFDNVCATLRSRQIYSDDIWAYSLLLDKGRRNQELGEFLANNAAFRRYVGGSLSCDVVALDFEAVRDYQITEFWPLLNPRSHQVAISSTEFNEYYADFLYMLAFKTGGADQITITDKLCLLNYLLRRKKTEKARALFDSIDAAEAKAACPEVYDYFVVYLSGFDADPSTFQSVAEKYVSQPLPASIKLKWSDVLEHLQHQSNANLSDATFLKKQEVARLKALEPFLDFQPQTDHTIIIEHRNVSEITINFYRTELELMFSMQPFQDQNTSYKLMMPNMTETLGLVESGSIISGETQIQLPDVLRGENTIVEMIAGDVKVCKVNYDNEIIVQQSKDTGEIRVLQRNSRSPIERAYCKVYAQSIRDGSSKFYKDGYTDCRGRFDYRYLSTDQLRDSTRLSILISTEKFGSAIQEVKIPNEFLTRSYLF